jgi:hypothetical protein
MRRRLACAALGLLLAPLRPLAAGAAVSSAYLLHGVSPQEDALGQCALAADGSLAEAWRDPAAIALQGRAGLALTHMVGPLGGDTEYLAAGLAWGGQALAVQAYYQGDSDTFRDDLGQIGDSFTNTESLLGLAYAWRLGGFSSGLGVKALGETLAGEQAQTGVLVDLGVQWRSGDGRWQLALAAMDLGRVPQWAGGTQYGPSTLDLAGRQALSASGAVRLLEDLRAVQPLDLGGAGWGAAAGPALLGAGLEWALPTPALPVWLRLGYTVGDHSPQAPADLSGGFGLDWGGVHVDYAFVWLGGLGGSHRLGLSWSLPAPAPHG